MMAIKSNVRRLLQYRMCLLKFREMGFSRIFSYVLAQEVGISPEQVRKDFSQFGLKGNKKAGYDVGTLLDLLNELFKIHEVNNVILVGMGNIGRALVNYNKRFIGTNLFIVAAFDIDPSKQNRRHGLPVLTMDQLTEVVKGFKVRMAIIAVPGISAQTVCNQLVENGIQGILNFAPAVLKVPDDVVVNDINLSIEMEAILFHLGKKQKIQVP